MTKNHLLLLAIVMTTIVISLLFWYNVSISQNDCPETVLYDFKQKVETKTDATELFREFFSEEDGYPLFNESKVEDYRDSDNYYVYVSPYGFTRTDEEYHEVGGLLYTNGKLVKQGYCK